MKCDRAVFFFFFDSCGGAARARSESYSYPLMTDFVRCPRCSVHFHSPRNAHVPVLIRGYVIRSFPYSLRLLRIHRIDIAANTHNIFLRIIHFRAPRPQFQYRRCNCDSFALYYHNMLLFPLLIPRFARHRSPP